MKEELEKLELAVTEVTNSNLSDETKALVLKEIKKRIFELRNDISKVEQDIRTYQGK